MQKNLFTKTASFVAVAALSLVGCKTGSESLINHIKLSQDSQSFEYVTTFGGNVEIDMEATLPIGKYGSLTFFKNDTGEFSVKLAATMDVFGDSSLVPVNTLPNGLAFPSIVNGSMFTVKLGKNVQAYFDTAGLMDAKKLAGLSLQFSNVDNNLPQVTITQNFFTEANKKFASFTVFGPTTKNGVTYPGGIFLVGDIAQAVDSIQGQGSSRTTRIAGPDADKYQTAEAQEKLLVHVKKAFAAQGVRIK
ncbi:MAG: hypothetical protein EOP04_13910 [Proteobacteria bacterium]|nr:MAG: hypothetical protein EOP04_13910 [Pseudomonadota bacterium]